MLERAVIGRRESPASIIGGAVSRIGKRLDSLERRKAAAKNIKDKQARKAEKRRVREEIRGLAGTVRALNKARRYARQHAARS
jgi:hypothetical protein